MKLGSVKNFYKEECIIVFDVSDTKTHSIYISPEEEIFDFVYEEMKEMEMQVTEILFID